MSLAGGSQVVRSVSVPTLARVSTVVLAHPVLDAYAGFVPPLLGVLEIRCSLTEWETASLLGIGPITSGLCQPLFAWLTDRVDSRVLGTLGVAVAAVCLSCVGLADDFWTLVVLFGVGMLGVGAFHPVAAASIGQIAGRRRSAGVTAFFVAGMLGATAGPVISTRITSIEPNGFDLLRWVMIPGLLTAALLHLAIRDVPHRDPQVPTADGAPSEAAGRWWTVFVLCAGNALRYSVNLALFYLYVRWAATVLAARDPTLSAETVATLGSIYAGELNAFTMLGMGVGGLAAGLLVRPGRERWPLVLIPIALAPALALFPSAGRWGSYGLAVTAGIGFAAVVPATISLAQRLLPHRTSLASSLVLGGAWGVAMPAAPLAEWTQKRLGLDGAFAVTAGLLALSGVIGLLLPPRIMTRAAGDR